MKSLVPLFCSLSTELGQEAAKICSKLFVGKMGLNHKKNTSTLLFQHISHIDHCYRADKVFDVTDACTFLSFLPRFASV